MGLLSALGGGGDSPFPAMSGIGLVQRIVDPPKRDKEDSDDGDRKKKRRKSAKKRSGKFPKFSLLGQAERLK